MRTLEQQSAVIILILSVLAILQFVWSWRTAQENRRMRTKWNALLEGQSGKNLEAVLYDHLRERLELEEQLRESQQRISTLEDKMMSAKRYTGLVRYDAFEDVGGSQSFCLAIYDDQGNGAIINSLVGRTDCRVYCKPLISGRSDRNLSQEEVRAIHDAEDRNPRPVITP
ncbi:MAG: DUF4446 family protein [Fimbriimonadaceae bacterium]|nr:DUF4446 family protein [Fimbriimonadaceae bacterium]